MNLGKALLIVLGFFHWLYAQDSFRVEFSSDKIGIEDTLNVYVTIASAQTYFQNQPQISSKDFELLPSSSTSTSIQIINGKTSFSQTHTYLLKPLKTGSLSFSTSFNGKSKESKIDVVYGSLAPKNSIPNQFLSPWDTQEDNEENSLVKPLVQYVLNKNNPYPNEPVFVKYYYYEPLGQGIPQDVSMYEAPSVSGGILSPLPKTTAAQYLKPTRFSDRLYIPHRIFQQILIPLKTDLNFKAGSISVDLASTSFWSSQVRNMTIKVTGPSISVKKLPPAPKDFSNIFASKVSLSAEIIEDAYSVGKPIAYDVRLKADGNLRFFNAPKLSVENASVNLVENKLKETPNDAQSILASEKTLTYYVIPKKEGDLSIPPLHFVSFNYEKGLYENFKTKPLLLNVGPSNQTSSPPPSSSFSSNAAESIAIKEGLSKSIPLKYLLFLSFFLSFCVLSLIVFYLRQNRKKEGDQKKDDLLKTIVYKIEAGEDLLFVFQFYLLKLAEKNQIESLSNGDILENLMRIHPSKKPLFESLKQLSEEIERKRFSPKQENNEKEKDSRIFLDILEKIHENKGGYV